MLKAIVVPGGSLMLLFIILQNMGLTTDQIAIIVGLAVDINPILDIVCTYAVALNFKLIKKATLK